MSMVSSGGVHARLALSGRSLVLAITAALAALAPPRRPSSSRTAVSRSTATSSSRSAASRTDFSFNDNLDLVQWYNVLSVETEYDFAPDGWGPFDVLSGFARIDVRYDCVWTRACGIFPSANAFGDRVAHLPGYKTTGRRSGYSRARLPGQPGQLRVGVLREVHRDGSLHGTEVRSRSSIRDQRSRSGAVPARQQNPRRPANPDQIDGLVGLFAIKGANQIFEANGDGRDRRRLRVGRVTYSTINDDPAYFYSQPPGSLPLRLAQDAGRSERHRQPD